jgi:rhodanese-related sulfurtransferase
MVITVQELAEAMRATARGMTLVDVRGKGEWDVCRLPGARWMPLGEIPRRACELNQDDHIVVYCHHGMRSQQAQSILLGLGYRKVVNLLGGIDAWAAWVDPSMPRY